MIQNKKQFHALVWSEIEPSQNVPLVDTCVVTTSCCRCKRKLMVRILKKDLNDFQFTCPFCKKPNRVMHQKTLTGVDKVITKSLFIIGIPCVVLILGAVVYSIMNGL